jgi:hypothetical protein
MILNNFVTTVATPRKWPGRDMPSLVWSNPCDREGIVRLSGIEE